VTTAEGTPSAPTAVAARFSADGTNVLMWALSEDDGYNDRDVVRYEVWQVAFPGGDYVKVGEAPAGVGLFCGTDLSAGATQFVGYAVSAVASNGVSSTLVPAVSFQPNGKPNRPPVMGPMAAGALKNMALIVQNTKLLARASDPDGDPLTIVAVGGTTTKGGHVSLGLATITFLPGTNFVGQDEFTFTISDGRGGLLTNTVGVTVLDIGGGLAGEVNGEGFTATFFGIPGECYTIEYKTNMTDAGWLWRTNLVAGTNSPGFGRIVVTESVAGLGNRFYRAVYPARTGVYPPP
jgi:hypothetical protein